MRITLEIQDQRLTPKAKKELLNLLHRIEAEPERFATGHSLGHFASGVSEALPAAKAQREPVTPIDPLEFFEEIQKTEGFPNKSVVHRHVRQLRNEWE